VKAVAVDWSGDHTAAGQRRHIWMATAENGVLEELSAARTRDEVVDALLAGANTASDVVVGLDFAFSYPAWFLRERGLGSAPELWELAVRQGEAWLAACEPPFWGRRGTTKPRLPADLRATDLDNVPAKSVFQIGGAGAVGTGSIRGMPCLRRLRDGGFSVWPFDPPHRPIVVEIYPRALTGAVTKSDPVARAAFLTRLDLDDEVGRLAGSSEDAFDAAVSALVMSRCEAELSVLEAVTDPTVLLEGVIWRPRGQMVPSTTGGRKAMDPVREEDASGAEVIGDAEDIGTAFQRHLGLRWSVVDKTTGAIAVDMDMRDDLRGPAGTLEGGVISTLVDVAGASAVAMKAGMVATEHIAVSFLAPGRVGPIRATGTPLRVGKHDGVAEVRVVDRGKDDRLMAVATVTLRVLTD
jgi:uncharacterized protein (TIGR00369 family)